MGIFDRLERGLERAVKQPFARVFKAEVQPVEIASAMRKSMDDRAAVLGPGRTMVPNVFTIELAESDHERLSSYDRALTDELVAAAEDHADSQRYVAPGPFEVRLTSGEDLETGIFRVRPAAKDGRRRSESAREYAESPDSGRDRRRGREVRGHEAPGRRRDHDESAAVPAAAGAAVAAGAAPDDDPHSAYRRPSSSPHAPSSPSSRTAEAPARPPRRQPQPRHAPVSLEVDGRRIPLTGAVSTLGRDEGCTVVVDDPGASRRHAEIRITHDGPHLQVILRDLGSTNGTYLNGEQVGSEELHRGDRITLGRTQLTVELEG